jgi:hypothetical protein
VGPTPSSPNGTAITFWGKALADGKATRAPELGDLDICVLATVSIGDGDHTAALRAARSRLALYIGGMGARGKNFYNELARRYGFEGRIRKDPGSLPGGQEGRGHRGDT